MTQDSTVVLVREIIRDALEIAYTSHSCKDDIATGNRYQTITIDGQAVEGFRTGRGDLFELFDFQDASVLDIGSNLGELSRLAAKMGAIDVTGIEYDAFFVLLAKLITLENGLSDRVKFIQGDITKKFKFERTWDYVFAFSVFTYMGHRVPEIFNSTKKALIVETHNVRQEDERQYYKVLEENFPIVITIGETDWGTASQFKDGRRLVIACFKSHELMWDFLIRCQKKEPKLSTLIEIDITRSRIPALNELKALDTSIFAEVLTYSEDVLSYEALGLPAPTSLSSASYWLDFWRGYKHYTRSGNIVEEKNPYLRLLQSMVQSGHHFDPGAMDAMRDPAVLLDRVERRLKGFESDSLSPCVFFVEKNKEPTIAVTDPNGRSWSVTDIDGYHRLAAAYMLGRQSHHGYLFPLALK